MPIAWDPATMSSGDPTVDQQRRQVIEWLNDLFAAMSAERAGAEVGAVLARLDTRSDPAEPVALLSGVTPTWGRSDQTPGVTTGAALTPGRRNAAQPFGE